MCPGGSCDDDQIGDNEAAGVVNGDLWGFCEEQCLLMSDDFSTKKKTFHSDKLNELDDLELLSPQRCQKLVKKSLRQVANDEMLPTCAMPDIPTHIFKHLQVRPRL